jgi:hypothetical protein
MDDLLYAIALEDAYQELISGDSLGPFTHLMPRAAFLGYLGILAGEAS